MLRYETRKIISCYDFDELVESTYGKPYRFQQQNNCRERGLYHIQVPQEDEYDYDEDVPKFEEWLDEPYYKDVDNFTERFRWYRSFYPDVSEIINDLLSKGLIEKGSYCIEID